MTEADFKQVDLDPLRLANDARLAALNLNAALQNLKSTPEGASLLLANRLWLRLLDDTDELLKQEGLKYEGGSRG